MSFNFGQTSNPGAGGLGAKPTGSAFGVPSSAPSAFGAPIANPSGFGSTAPAGFGAPSVSAAGFGAPSAAPGGFGAPSAAPAGFGAPSATPAGFGAPSAAPAGFGAPSAAPAGFGAPSAAPAGFGAPSAAPAGFGAPSAAPVGFGAPSAAPAGFGAPSAAPVGFGAPSAAPAGFGAPSAAPTGFGAPSAAPAGFGAPSAAPAGFGAPSAAPAGFGAPSATPAGFGAPSATPVGFGPPSATSSGFGAPSAAPSVFGAPTAVSSGFAPISSSGVSIGVAAPQVQGSLFASPTTAAKPVTQSATITPLLGTSQAPAAISLLGVQSSAPSSLSSGLFSGLSTAKPPTQFGTTSAAPTLNFGSGSSFSSLAPVSTSAQGFSLGGPAPSVGLGGVDTSSSASGLSNLSGLAGSHSARPEAKSPKETPIPDDIGRGVETFRQYVKKQKSFSSEIARCSSKPLLKVQEDTDAMKQVLSSSTAGHQRLRSIADKLKADTAKALQHTEMAQRTHDTPPGLQYDNTAPLQYFAELVAGFERDIKLYRQEIENAERHVHSRVQLTTITPAELTQAMRRLYDSFVALAGRLHTVHSQVKAQKEQYLSLRKYILNDASDVFDEAARNRINAEASLGGKGTQQSRSMVGPTPFSALNAQHGFGLLSAGVAASSRQNFAAVGSLGWSSPGTSSLPLTPHPENTQFQLQKPPSGNKRGKR